MSLTARKGSSFLTFLLLGLLLLMAGAAGAVWALGRWDAAAAYFGIGMPAPAAAPVLVRGPSSPVAAASPLPVTTLTPDAADRVSALEARLSQVESATARAEGSAGRADALLVAFAARRAIDRGVALGYLEPLLTDRFGPTHRQAVATIITASRRPVRLDQLVAEFEALEPVLKKGRADEGLWEGLRRELGSLVTVRRADRPSPRPSPTYERARARLVAGQVDQALAEAMRLPGISAASKWVADARTYVAAHHALDEIETAALLVP